MSKDVLITPATGLVEFKGASGNTDATIQLDDSGNLNLTSPNGDISIGDTTSDLYIGDGVNSVDIIFEQNGAVRALTGKTLTLGQSDATVIVNAPLQITNTTLVANLNADLLDGLSSASFANATFANTDFTTISTTAGTYANASHVPVITLAANGRVSSIVNTAISFPVTSVAGVTGAVSNTQLRSGLLTVDGSGSGLDADLLDGQQGSYYLDTSSSSQTKSGNLTVSGITTTGQQRFVNSYVQHFSQVYSGGATGSPAGYFSNGEFQEICTFTPSASSQNCQVIGRIAIQSGGNSQIIYFQAALRSGTLPDLAWTTSYYEEVNGGVRYADPVVWAKETTTAAFKLALNGLATIFGTVTVDLDVIHRYNTGYPDFVMNTTVSSEVLSVPAGYTSYDFTKLYSINDGKVEIEGTTASTSNTTGALTVNGGVGIQGNVAVDSIIFPDGTTQNTASVGGGGSSYNTSLLFTKEDGTTTNLTLRVADTQLTSALNSVYLPFITSGGTSKQLFVSV